MGLPGSMPSANFRTFSSCFLSCFDNFDLFSDAFPPIWRCEILSAICAIKAKATEALDDSPLIFWKTIGLPDHCGNCQDLTSPPIHSDWMFLGTQADIWLIFHQQEVVCRNLEVPAQSSLNPKSSCENITIVTCGSELHGILLQLATPCDKPRIMLYTLYTLALSLPPAMLCCFALCLGRLANSRI